MYYLACLLLLLVPLPSTSIISLTSPSSIDDDVDDADDDDDDDADDDEDDLEEDDAVLELDEVVDAESDSVALFSLAAYDDNQFDK